MDKGGKSRLYSFIGMNLTALFFMLLLVFYCCLFIFVLFFNKGKNATSFGRSWDQEIYSSRGEKYKCMARVGQNLGLSDITTFSKYFLPSSPYSLLQKPLNIILQKNISLV